MERNKKKYKYSYQREDSQTHRKHQIDIPYATSDLRKRRQSNDVVIRRPQKKFRVVPMLENYKWTNQCLKHKNAEKDLACWGCRF